MLWGIVGIVITLCIYYLQKQRGKFNINLNVKIEPSPKNKDGIYQNSEGTQNIDVGIKVISNHSRPILIDSFFIAIPSIQWFCNPSWILIYLSPKQFITTNFGNIKLPHKLEPGKVTNEQFITGLKVANILTERGFKNNVKILIGFFDENKNPYYSDPKLVNVEKWNKDNGRLLAL